MNIIKNEMPPANYKELPIRSPEIDCIYGTEAADAIEIGTLIILEYLTEDIRILSLLPSGTHLGQIPNSYLKDILPKQFITNYTYDFCYLAKCRVLDMIDRLDGIELPNTLDKILFYMIATLGYSQTEKNLDDKDTCPKMWLNDFIGDRHLLNLFYEGGYYDEKHSYHFKNWI